MIRRFSIPLAAWILLAAQPIASASSITYDFTGTLIQPFDGSTKLSGSFTVNGNPTLGPGYPEIQESGSDVSLTVNLGGRVITFVNTPQLPISITLSASVVPPENEVPPGSSTIGFSLSGEASGGDTFFGLTFYSPGGVDKLSNLRDLSFPLDTSSIYMRDLSGGSYQEAFGVITSIEAVSVPEPATVLMYLSALALVRVWRRTRAWQPISAR
jgi:hypothetical protein